MLCLKVIGKIAKDEERTGDIKCLIDITKDVTRNFKKGFLFLEKLRVRKSFALPHPLLSFLSLCRS